MENIRLKEDNLGASSGCRLHCLINLEEGNSALCNNSDTDEPLFLEDTFDDSGIKFNLDAINGGKRITKHILCIQFRIAKFYNVIVE